MPQKSLRCLFLPRIISRSSSSSSSNKFFFIPVSLFISPLPFESSYAATLVKRQLCKSRIGYRPLRCRESLSFSVSWFVDVLRLSSVLGKLDRTVSLYTLWTNNRRAKDFFPFFFNVINVPLDSFHVLARYRARSFVITSYCLHSARERTRAERDFNIPISNYIISLKLYALSLS